MNQIHEQIRLIRSEIEKALIEKNIEKLQALTEVLKLLPEEEIRIALSPVDKEIQASGLEFIKDYLKGHAYLGIRDVETVLENLSTFQIDFETSKKMLTPHIQNILKTKELDLDEKADIIKLLKKFF